LREQPKRGRRRVACTIVARNYLPFARVLARSFAEHHPGVAFETLVVDGASSDLAGAELSVRGLDSIGLAAPEQLRMATIYDATELATAVKPWLLSRLLEEGAAEAMYLDPDIEIFDSLDDLFELARRHSIVLTPHARTPIPQDGAWPAELDILRVGVYNLGFLALGGSARPMLQWWQDRLRRDAIRDPPQMLFTDQRWVDLVPGYFPHVIVRDPTIDVAYWNLHGVRLERGEGGVTIDGRPLRFFHFSGFDPRQPGTLSSHPAGGGRVKPAANPALAELCRSYAKKLLAAGYRTAAAERYGFATTPAGMAIDPRMRRLYRAELMVAEANGTPEPPNPFHDGHERFLAWLRAPVSPELPVSRYLYEVYRRRADLQVHFPDLARSGARGFLDWVRRSGTDEVGVPPELMPTRQDRDPDGQRRPALPGAPEPGINVAGYFEAELGVGEAARQLLAGVQAAGLAYATVPFARTVSRQAAGFGVAAEEPRYDVNLICVNADQVPAFAAERGAEFFSRRYNIGLWFWETSDLPASMHAAFDYVDEVWTASDHVRTAVASVSPRPVFEIPLPVVPGPAPVLKRADLSLPEGFLFLFTFDFLSVFARKNPLGVIEAFRRAFPSRTGAWLLVKSINGDKKPAELARLQRAAAGRDDILVRDGYLDPDQIRGLTATCDCYVSLHRAEGFGLTMAEAMACAKPVIATAYSGNLAFMNEDNSYLVGWEPVPVGAENPPYLPSTTWADPDLDAAAHLMRRVYEHPDEARAKGARARRDILKDRSPERAAAFIRERLEAVRANPDNWLSNRGEIKVTSPGADGGGRSPAEDLPTRHGGAYGAAARVVRRLVLRLIRPYRMQQDAVNAALAGDVQALRSDVEAIPFMSDPGLLRTRDHQGRAAIGYRGLAGDGSVVYRGFEDIFRGDEDFIRERQRGYLELLAGHQPVLEAGCGRGEMLDLLREAGIPAIGIDLDAGMVERCRAKGHQAEQVGVLEYLERQPDGSLGAIFAARVIEHLKYDDLQALLRLARRKLKPAGVMILETVNPHSARALKTFWVDLTHEKPIFPEVAVAICRLHGFEEAIVIFPNGSGDLERDLYSQGEYAVVARTAAAAPAVPRPRRKARPA